MPRPKLPNALTPAERRAKHRASGRRIDLVLSGADLETLAQARACSGAGTDAQAIRLALRCIVDVRGGVIAATRPPSAPN